MSIVQRRLELQTDSVWIRFRPECEGQSSAERVVAVISNEQSRVFKHRTRSVQIKCELSLRSMI
jgi:hypothetical protein